MYTQAKWWAIRLMLYLWFQRHEVTRSISTPPPAEMLVHCRVTPGIKFVSTYFYTYLGGEKQHYLKYVHVEVLLLMQNKKYNLKQTIDKAFDVDVFILIIPQENI